MKGIELKCLARYKPAFIKAPITVEDSASTEHTTCSQPLLGHQSAILPPAFHLTPSIFLLSSYTVPTHPTGRLPNRAASRAPRRIIMRNCVRTE